MTNGPNARLGNRIREVRLARRLTQDDVATIANINRSYVSQIEHGRIDNPSYTVLRGIAKALDTSLDDLLQAAGYISPPDEIPALDDPELILYLDEIGNFPKHDQEIIKGVLRTMREAHQKYGKEND